MDLKRNSDVFISVYEDAAQLVDRLSELLADPETDPESLEHSVIPTSIVYDLALNYMELYDELVALTVLSPTYKNLNKNVH